MSEVRQIKDPSRFVVKQRRCDQCPFSKNQTIVTPGAILEIIDELHTSNRPFICHRAIVADVDLVCRGFYDEQPNLVVRLAQMLEIVEFAELREKTDPENGYRATQGVRRDR